MLDKIGSSLELKALPSVKAWNIQTGPWKDMSELGVLPPGPAQGCCACPETTALGILGSRHWAQS